MSISKSPLWYSDCYEAMERALEDVKGVRLRVSSEGEANFLRMRLNQARALNREENKNVYHLGDPLHGRSVYDKLMFKIIYKKGKNGDSNIYVYLLQVNNINLEIEPLSEVEPDEEEAPPSIEQVEDVEVKSLTSPKLTNVIPMVVRRKVLVRRI